MGASPPPASPPSHAGHPCSLQCNTPGAATYAAGCVPATCKAGFYLEGQQCLACNAEGAATYSSGAPPPCSTARLWAPGWLHARAARLAASARAARRRPIDLPPAAAAAACPPAGCTVSSCKLGWKFDAATVSCNACQVPGCTAYSTSLCACSACATPGFALEPVNGECVCTPGTFLAGPDTCAEVRVGARSQQGVAPGWNATLGNWESAE